ncbi:MAG: hypothetical protein GY827_00800 [Cytophagales bacterium]|nr:hypothetical protein [Cytophagales bacterium]
MLKYSIATVSILLLLYGVMFYYASEGWGYLKGYDIEYYQGTRTYSSGPSFWYGTGNVSYYRGEPSVRSGSVTGGSQRGGGIHAGK